MLFKCRIGHSSIFCLISGYRYNRTCNSGSRLGAVACESTGVGKLCKVEWEVLAAALKQVSSFQEV